MLLDLSAASECGAEVEQRKQRNRYIHEIYRSPTSKSQSDGTPLDMHWNILFIFEIFTAQTTAE